MCILPGKAISKMSYTVSGGMLNSTHSLTHSLTVTLNFVTMALYQIAFGLD